MNPKKILVVEDEDYLSDLYKEILEDQGYFVETVKDGNDAMVKMRTGGWDLVLLDIILPGMDGIEIMKNLKQKPPLVPNKKVIFLTNLDKDKEMQEAQKLGDDYIIKSTVTPKSLIEKIHKYIEENNKTS